jgi:hypothetical protein
MTDQQELDIQRQICSAALKQLISESHNTELLVRTLSLPISLDAAQQFSSQHDAEVHAHEAYMVASSHLAAFVQQHLDIIN